MKRMLFALFVLMIMLSACAPQPAATDLPAPIEAVAIAANVEARVIVHDAVIAGAIQRDSHARVELDDVVPDAHGVGPHEHDVFHALNDAIAASASALYVAEIHGGAETKPCAR